MFKTFLAEPIYNLLIWVYQTLPVMDIGLSIIVLTIVIRLILWPLTGRALKGQKAMQELQPKIEKLKKEYGDNREEMAKKMMELYKEEKVNPASSCLPLVVQSIILIALYRVFLVGLNNESTYQLYEFVANPGFIDPTFLGFLDLSVPSIPLAIVAAAFQFIQVRMLSKRQPPKPLRNKEGAKDENAMAAMNKSMMYFMPLLTVGFGSFLPGGLALYWLFTTVVSILQQWLIFKKRSGSETKEVAA